MQIARSAAGQPWVGAAAALNRRMGGQGRQRWVGGRGALRFAQVPARGHLLEVEVVLQGVEHGVVDRAGPV